MADAKWCRNRLGCRAAVAGSSAGKATPARRRASMTWDQKTSGRLSNRSTVTHATGPDRDPSAAQEASAIVLPAPGGPVTTVRGPRDPLAISAVIRSRETFHLGSAGTVILETRTESSALAVRRARRAIARAGVAGMRVPLNPWRRGRLISPQPPVASEPPGRDYGERGASLRPGWLPFYSLPRPFYSLPRRGWLYSPRTLLTRVRCDSPRYAGKA